MPATAVTVTRPTINGVADPTPVDADPTNGNSVPNVAGLILTLNNTDASSHDVIFTTSATHGGYDVSDKTVTIAATTKRNFSNFPASSFGRTLVFTANSTTVKVSAMAPAS
jgi:hypothetical protein